jgi:hypothetical protein
VGLHRILVSVAVLFLAAACSGTGNSPKATTDTTPKVAPYTYIDPATLTPEYVASLPRDQAEAAISSIHQTYFRRALDRCPVDADDCINRQFEAAFDQSGELAPLCKVNGTGMEYRICLLSAAETVPMVAAAGGNPAADIDWSDVDSTNNAGRRQFIEFISAKKCGSDTRCIVDQAAALLGLSPAVAKSCQLHEAPSERMNCVSDAKGAELYQRAINALS